MRFIFTFHGMSQTGAKKAKTSKEQNDVKTAVDI